MGKNRILQFRHKFLIGLVKLIKLQFGKKSSHPKKYLLAPPWGANAPIETAVLLNGTPDVFRKDRQGLKAFSIANTHKKKDRN